MSRMGMKQMLFPIAAGEIAPAACRAAARGGHMLAISGWLLLGALALGAGRSDAAENAFGTAEQEEKLIANICGTQMGLGAAECACVAERAMAGLDEQQRGYLILSAVQPPAAERMPIARSKPDLATIFTLLDTARRECPPGAPAAEPGSAAAPAPAQP